jgi:hypothetical protein
VLSLAFAPAQDFGRVREGTAADPLVHVGGRRPSAKIRVFVDVAVTALRANEASSFKA